MPRLVLLVAVWLSFLCASQEGVPQSRSQPKRIPVRLYGFTVETPAGWRAGVGNDGLPVFVNFPWSKMQAQLRLPAGGAVINVISWDSLLRRRGDESLAGWAHLDAVRAAPGTEISRVLDVPPSTEISEAILVSFDEETFGPNDQAQRDVSVYWTYRRERFAAHLSYVAGDPKGLSYGDVLKHIVFSIRPLG